MEAVAADPTTGASACRHLGADLRQDCLSAAAEALAADAEAAAGLCAELPDGLWRDECFFQVAEISDQPQRCASAGRFSLDCRMHLWTRGLFRLLPDRTEALASQEQAIEEAALSAGFQPDDPRPWVAAFRVQGARMRPLDRSQCAALSTAARQGACAATLLDLYGDLLNHARDTGRFPCDGSPLTGPLAHAPDPELDALVARRRAGDLCP